jgi:hypothetical protein
MLFLHGYINLSELFKNVLLCEYELRIFFNVKCLFLVPSECINLLNFYICIVTASAVVDAKFSRFTYKKEG